MLIIHVRQESRSRFIIPKSDPLLSPKTKTQLDKEADHLVALRSEAERSGDQKLWQKFWYEKHQNEAKKYWQNEETNRYNEEMRETLRAYRGY